MGEPQCSSSLAAPAEAVDWAAPVQTPSAAEWQVGWEEAVPLVALALAQGLDGRLGPAPPTVAVAAAEEGAQQETEGQPAAEALQKEVQLPSMHDEVAGEEVEAGHTAKQVVLPSVEVVGEVQTSLHF